MIKKEFYFIEIIPFSIVEKKSNKTLIVTNKGKYKVLDTLLVKDFKRKDSLVMSKMIGGNGIVEIKYFKLDELKARSYLSNVFYRFREN